MGVSLDFLWHMRGEAHLGPATSGPRVMARIAAMLDRQRKAIDGRGADFIEFDDPLWRNPFGPNWLAMVIYDRGRFWIEHDGARGARLRYDLRSLHGFVFCLGAASIAFPVGLLGEGLAGGLKLFAMAFGWLYGMNMVLAYARIPILIRKAAYGG
jgi:hypothetical protein